MSRTRVRAWGSGVLGGARNTQQKGCASPFQFGFWTSSRRHDVGAQRPISRPLEISRWHARDFVGFILTISVRASPLRPDLQSLFTEPNNLEGVTWSGVQAALGTYRIPSRLLINNLRSQFIKSPLSVWRTHGVAHAKTRLNLIFHPIQMSHGRRDILALSTGSIEPVRNPPAVDRREDARRSQMRITALASL